MKRLVTTICVFFPFIFFAQVTGEIYGTIVDEKNIPVAGASVILENTTKGAQTDFDGKYIITNIEPGSYNLIASYIGYETQTKFNILVKSKGNQSYDFVLVDSAEA